MATQKVSSLAVPPQVVPSTPKRIAGSKKRHCCPACEGTGRLSNKELARYRKCVELANITVQQVNGALSDFSEYVSDAESLLLNQSDQEFLSGLKISSK
jgi:hypothetical protein